VTLAESARIVGAVAAPGDVLPASRALAELGPGSIGDLFGHLDSGRIAPRVGPPVVLDPLRRVTLECTLSGFAHTDLVRFLGRVARESTREHERVTALRLLGRTAERSDLVLAFELGTPPDGSLPGPDLRRALASTLTAALEHEEAALADLCALFARTTPVTRPTLLDVVGVRAGGAAAATLGELLGVAGPEADALVLMALAEIPRPSRGSDDPAGRERVRRFLAHSDHRLVALACRAVEHLRDHGAVPDLIALLGSSSSDLVASAHRALTSLTGLTFPADLGAWMCWLDRSLDWWAERAQPCREALLGHDPVRSARAIAEVAAQRLYLDDVVELLEQALQRPEPDQVLAAARSLLSIPTPGARAALESLRAHPDPRVSGAARAMLARLASAPRSRRSSPSLQP
jgi:hypothetical protein